MLLLLIKFLIIPPYIPQVTTVKMENAERKENGVSMDSQDQPVPNVERRETREKTEPPVMMDHPEARPPKVIVVPMVWTDPLERREIRERGVAMDKQVKRSYHGRSCFLLGDQ